MKLLKYLIPFLLPMAAFGAAGDVIFSQKNSNNTATIQVIVPQAINSIFGMNTVGTPVAISNAAGLASLGIGTGTTTAVTALQVVDTGTVSPRGITDDQYNTGTNSAQMNVRKARGTFASPTTIVTGDILGRYLAWGHDGTQFIESGNIRFTSSGTIGTNRVPSQFEVWTSTDASPSVLTKQVTVDNTGLMTLTRSMVLAAPTGGDKGAGTINATGIYINGVAVGTGSGDVVSSGTPVANQIAIWTDASTIKGLTNLTYSGTTFTLTNAGTVNMAQTSTVNGATVQTTQTGLNSTGTTRIARFGLNRFADDVWSLDNGTTEYLRVNLTNGTTTLNSAVASTSISTGAFIVNNKFAVGGASGNMFVGGTSTFQNTATVTTGGFSNLVLTTSSATNYSEIDLTNTGASGRTWGIYAAGNTASSNPGKLAIDDNTRGAHVATFDSAGLFTVIAAATIGGNFTVSGSTITLGAITPSAGLVAVGHKFPMTFADGVHNVLTD